MRTQFVILMLALTGALTACIGASGPLTTIRGSGIVVTEERTVGGFTSISLEGIGQLVIDQTGSESLTITADDNLLPYIETRVRGRQLIIGVQTNTIFRNVTDLTYHITADVLDSVELNGVGTVQVNNLNGDNWRADLSGGGNIVVSGTVGKQTVEINGAGAYTADELASREAVVRHSGAGLAVVQVSEQLDVRIDGMGSVEYLGNPTVKQTINGLGSVRQR